MGCHGFFRGSSPICWLCAQIKCLLHNCKLSPDKVAEIHQEMSELLNKQVNVQKEKTSGVNASSRKPTNKVCNENEIKKQEKITRIKIIFMEGSPL